MVYTFRANSIYPSSKWYIPFEQKVYSSRRRGIFLAKHPDFTLSASDLIQSAAPPLTGFVSEGAAGGFSKREGRLRP